MVLEIAGTPDRMEADDAALPDCLRLIGIDILKFQVMRTARRLNRDRTPYSALYTRRIGDWCGSGHRFYRG